MNSIPQSRLSVGPSLSYLRVRGHAYPLEGPGRLRKTAKRLVRRVRAFLYHRWGSGGEKRRIALWVLFLYWLGVVVLVFWVVGAVVGGIAPVRKPVAVSKEENRLQKGMLDARRWGRGRGLSARQDADEVLHVAMIFDRHRANFSRTVMRSLGFHVRSSVVFHLVVPEDVRPLMDNVEQEFIGPVRVVLYDYGECRRLVSRIWFTSKKIHLSAMCKIFLADILRTVRRALYLDSDTMIIQDLRPCWFRPGMFQHQQYIGMAVDMGESCQDDPNLCYPIGFEWQIPPGLQCGTVPYRAARLQANNPHYRCVRSGELETYQFNGGVMLMDLEKMRERNFTDKFVRTSIFTWKQLGFKQAHWGEQDLINNFFRFYPETLYELDCGCNFQYSAARREVKCPGKPIVIAHAWSRQLLDVTSHDPNNRYFNYFRFNIPDQDSQVPRPPLISLAAPDWNASSSPKKPTPLCSHQSHPCNYTDRMEAERMPLYIHDKVYVLTRTARRPLFFRESRLSVEEQIHPHVKQLIVSDDPESMFYLNGTSATLIPSLYDQFDSKEVCNRCKGPDGQSCARAPPLSRPKPRQKFFDCFCSTGYPMNLYVDHHLHRQVREPGWILYLDDDNLLLDKFSISELLAHAKSTDELLAFRSHLGRLTPSDYNFGRRIVMGDFDASNFAFHSKHLKHAVWGDRRCGDFRAGASLAKQLPVRWIDRSFIQAHPLRAELGGLGMRGELAHARLTVVITSYQNEGWRPNWLRQTLKTYLSEPYRPLIDKVILIWNNLEKPVPSVIPQESERLQILRPKINSLNNRWAITAEHIDTELVLNLDDDLYITKEGIICMMHWQRKERTRLVGPFVRRVEGKDKYVLDELKDSSPYTMVLPRAILIPRSFLSLYVRKEFAEMRNYVDSQAAHCDDVLLNLVALRFSEKPPLRVLLPEHTIVDYYSYCWGKSKVLTGGLGLQSGRTTKRTECVKHMSESMGFQRMKDSRQLGTCLPRGNALSKEVYAEPSKYDAMLVPDIQCGE